MRPLPFRKKAEAKRVSVNSKESLRTQALSLLLTVSLILGLLPAALAYTVPDYGPQDPTAKLAAGIPMSVSHRADWRNYPENSLLAIQSNIHMGVDVSELDVKMTSDGVVVLSHDTSISRCTGTNKKIPDMTWEELKPYPLKPQQGSGGSPYILTAEDADLLNSLPHYAEHVGEPAAEGGTMPTSRLDDAIDLIDKRCMINLDHCFDRDGYSMGIDLFTACYTLFRENDMLDHVFFKNSVNAATMNQWYEAAANVWNGAHPDDPITAQDVQESILYVFIHSSADPAPLQSHLDNGDNLVMVEICIGNNSLHESMMNTLEPWCMEKGVAMFVNTMWSGLCGTWPDTQTTWARMLDRGYTAIQTDRPGELSVYLNTINSSRKATDCIEAEHISSFRYAEGDQENDSFGFSIPAVHDGDLNKYVENMISGDCLIYRDIEFTGSEGLLQITAKALAEDSSIVVYLDGLEGDDRVANLSPDTSRDYEEYTLELTQAVSPGMHTIYIESKGLPNTALFCLDRFRFLSHELFQGEADIQQISVTTQPNVEPQLPGSVQVTYGKESFGFRVEWGPISASKYAQEGSFSVSGYVPMLQDYITANITVQAVSPQITQEGLALWLDASEGVSAGGDGTVSSWTSRVGTVTATKKAGSPKLIAPAAGQAPGIRFDGSSAMDLSLPEGFWNDKQDFTVLLYNSSECVTSGAESGTDSQYHSVLYFGESGSWGSAYFTPSQNEVIFRFGSGVSNDYGTAYVRPSNIGSSYSCTAIRKNGYKNSVFMDGSLLYTGSAQSDTAQNISSSGWIGLGKNGNYHTGTVCEILIYDRALSDEEILSAHAALAEKYVDTVTAAENVTATCTIGMAPSLPAFVQVTYSNGRTGTMAVAWEKIHPRNYQSAGTFPVSGVLSDGRAVTALVTVEDPLVTPFDQSKLLLWLSAQQGVTADADGKVSSWVGVTANQTSAEATQTAANKMPTAVKDGDTVTAVSFNGSGTVMDLALDTDLFDGKSGMTAVIYSKPGKGAPSSISNNGNDALLWFPDKGDWGGLYLGAYTNGMAGRFGTGTANYRGVLYKNGSYSDHTTTVLIKDRQTDKILINGTAITDNILKDSSTPRETTANIAGNKGTLGYGKNAYWQGEVSEIMIFDHALNDAELGLVYTYLNDIYNAGLTVEKKEPTTDGLVFWMDASEGVTTDSDGKVTAWASQGNTNVTAAQDKGKVIVRNSAPGNHPSIIFDAQSTLKMELPNDALNQMTGATAIIYAASETPFRTTGSSDAWRAQRNTVFYAGETGTGWGSVFVGVYTDTISARFGTGTANDNGFFGTKRTSHPDFSTTVVRWNANNSKAYEVTVDGSAFGPSSPITSKAETTKNNSNTVYLGTGKIENSNYSYWKGSVGDILLYNRALTDQELSDIQSYLSLKYAASGGEKGPVAVTGLFLQEEGTRIPLHTGEKRQLEATVLPMDAEEQGLTWSSSDEDVVTVSSSGLITAVGTGSAAIVVTSVEGGFQAYCTVKVTKSEQEVLWESIQSVKTWAESQNTSLYTNWNTVMAGPLAAIGTVTAASSVEELTEVYTTLDEAILQLEKAAGTVTVTFNSAGGSLIREQVLAWGGTATQPQAPTKSGYTFAGWFTDAACTHSYSFSTPVDSDLTLYAKWTERPPVVPSPDPDDDDDDAPPHTHRWSEWTVTVEPGPTTPGERSRICRGCGRVDIEILPATGKKPEEKPLPYTDVEPSAWYREAVAFVTETGIMKCLGAKDSFRPQVNTTRAMFVNALFRMDGGKADPELDQFFDMEDTAGAVAWGSKNSIVNGCDDGAFHPDQEITREQLVVFLHRYASFKKYDLTPAGDLSGFSDREKVSSWAREAMEWAVDAGLIQGNGDSQIVPQGLATRCEVAAVMMRFVEQFPSEK